MATVTAAPPPRWRCVAGRHHVRARVPHARQVLPQPPRRAPLGWRCHAGKGALGL